jgi:ComF family protein
VKRKRRARQYIEPMHFMSSISPLTSRLAWPGECALCGGWGLHTVCATCASDWAAPCVRCPRCAASHAKDPGGSAACADCEAHSPEFDRAVAAVHYAAPWSTLIARLKFQGRSELGAPLGRLLADAVKATSRARHQPWPDLVLPVPLSARRLAERGFNQSCLIARACAAELKLPCKHQVLRRVQHTERLMSMSAEARALALDGAFDVPPELAEQVAGRHVALVDDVLTTGATMDAASLALREAGAHSISAWVVAKTGRPT